MRVTVVAEPFARVCADVLVVGFFEDVKPPKGLAGHVDWLTGGGLSRLIVGDRVSGRVAETALLAVPTFSTQRVLFVGLGRAANYNDVVLQQVAEALRSVLAALRVKVAAVELLGTQVGGLDPVVIARTFVKAWQNGSKDPEIDLTFLAPRGQQPRQLEHRLREMGV